MSKKKIFAALAAVAVVVLAIFAVRIALENTNETEEVISSSLVNQAALKGPSSSRKPHSRFPTITEAPENSESTVDKSGATMFPGDKESTSSPSTSTKPNTSSSSTSSSSTSSSTGSSTSTSKPSSESSTSSSSSSSTGTSQSTSTPAPETSSSSSSTPSSNDSTKVTQGSTGSTSFGTSYPILSEFNSIGISSNASSFWSINDDADEYATAVGEANRALGKAVGSLESTGVAFTLDGTGCIISCGSAWVERQPSKGQYLFVYGADFNALSDGGALSREIIKVMLGTSVTSTPIEVEKALFEDCFGDNEQFPLNVWVACGDCEIKFVYSDDTRAEYAIRAKQ